MSSPTDTTWAWLRNGDEAFTAMLAAIEAARNSIRLETYIYAASPIGERFRDALIRARHRGVCVKVLVDALGSLTLPDAFWAPLRDEGGEARFFNPLALRSVPIRNHRKVLVCDDAVAFVGGFNIAPEYEGDGVSRGWRDLGLRLEGPLVEPLAASFDNMFALADFRHKRFPRLRRKKLKQQIDSAGGQLLLGCPGLGRNPIRRALHEDLRRAQSVQLIVAYFLPTGRLRRDIKRVARRGGQTQLILAGKSDVALSQLAARSLYRRLLRGGTEICEYTPQILHAKLFIIDDIVYVGSANLDPRSLSINYELMLRFEDARMVAEAREIFKDTLKHCQPIEFTTWKKSRSLWERIRSRWAYFILARIDPWLAFRQWRGIPD